MPTARGRSADVLVIGGGFAGVAAARELSHAGLGVVVLEARDRLGGRTWRAERLGRPLELGGTWIHWYQPHVWGEVTRYGLTVVESPSAEQCAWIVDGELHRGSRDELWALLDDGMVSLLKDAVAVFPRPYDSPSADVSSDLDRVSVATALSALPLTPEQRAVTDAMWATNFCAPTTDGGIVQALRWCALTGGDWRVMFDALATFKIDEGTSGLIDAMREDGDSEIVLAAPVRRIAHDDESVEVTLGNGESLTANAAIVTVPINALRGIELEPQPSGAKRRIIAEGQASRGLKVWIRIKGRMDPFFAYAPSDHALTLVQYEYAVEGDSLLVGFGPDASRLDVNDREAVERAVRTWLPQAEVVGAAGQDWVRDEFSRQTWPMLRPGQFDDWKDFQRPEGAVYFAGSDYAVGWMGFIDGAIESGMRAALEVKRRLGP